MLNESFTRAVVAEKARRRDEVAEVHRLLLSAPAPARRRTRSRVRIPRPAWPLRAGRRAPRLRQIGEDGLAP
jgi:hypothetical protein